MTRALVLSPHSDDAVISLGSTLYNEFTQTTVVVPFNRSLESLLELAGEVTELRRAEDRAISDEYGFSFVYGELPDTSLRGVRWDSTDEPVDQELLGELGGWLSQVTRGTYDAAFYPAAVGRHPDHVLCNLAAPPAMPSCSTAYRYIEQPYAFERRLPLGPSVRRQPFDPDFKRRMLSKYPSQLTPERVDLLVRLREEYFEAW